MQSLRCIGMCLALLLATNVAHAAGLSITAADLTWTPAIQGTPSPFMEIEVLNDAETDLLGGWTLDLALQQVSGTGTLQFNSRSIAVLGTDYILSGNSSGLSGSITSSSIFAFDFDPGPIIGVTVPASGKYLLAIDFTRVGFGEWDLVAKPGFTGWSDQLSNDREFTNVPFSGSNPVVLGSIMVVPEPATLSLGLLGGSLVGVLALARRRQRACRSHQ